MANVEYKTIPINNGIDKTLYSKAVLKSKLKIAMNPLVIPQPKQEMPNMFFIGHKEVENIFVKIYSKTKKANPTPKECKVCFFLLFGLLQQWLSITVSETT